MLRLQVFGRADLLKRPGGAVSTYDSATARWAAASSRCPWSRSSAARTRSDRASELLLSLG
ncbi:hypothetical protein EV648_12711 [Kribbella sp. VKM Ac-2568]|nr:hypothetical protein EV648_12711 [Kribbella sp. VKM Ac-2568]